MLISQKQARNALMKIAQEKGISIFEVRQEIELAIKEGMKSTDRRAIQFWSDIPHQHSVPTPEEVMIYLARTFGQQK